MAASVSQFSPRGDHIDTASSYSSDFMCADSRHGSDATPGARSGDGRRGASSFARLGPIDTLGSFTTQSRSLVMAFLVRLRIFPDQPAGVR